MRIFLINPQGPDNIVNEEGEFANNLMRELAKFPEDEISLLCLGIGDAVEQEYIKFKHQRKRISINIVRFFTKDSKNIKSPFDGTPEEQVERFKDFNDQVIRFLDLQKGQIHVLGSGMILDIARGFKEFASTVEHHDPRRILVTIFKLDSVDFSVKSEKDALIFNKLKSAEETSLKFGDLIIIHDKSLDEQLKDLYPETYSKEKIRYVPLPTDDWTEIVAKYREIYRSFI
ncbi:MAG: hypothetical protein ACXQS8_03890 [Candidatus Helarchaeales archaeon]